MTKIVGILNITENSFSDGGQYNTLKSAYNHFENMIRDGADIIDIGAQSTSYGAPIISETEEWKILNPFLQLLYGKDALKNVSIDTFNPTTAKKAIDMGVSIINDVSGCKSEEMLKLISKNPNVKYVSMFSVCLPTRHDLRTQNFNSIIEWMKESIRKMKDTGIKDEQIILDPGIGFATGPALSFEVIKRIDEIKKLEYPVMIGASRKTFIASIANITPEERDLETTLISCYLKKKDVEYTRVHNVSWHKRAFNLMETLKKECI